MSRWSHSWCTYVWWLCDVHKAWCILTCLLGQMPIWSLTTQTKVRDVTALDVSLQYGSTDASKFHCTSWYNRWCLSPVQLQRMQSEDVFLICSWWIVKMSSSQGWCVTRCDLDALWWLMSSCSLLCLTEMFWFWCWIFPLRLEGQWHPWCSWGVMDGPWCDHRQPVIIQSWCHTALLSHLNGP